MLPSPVVKSDTETGTVLGVLDIKLDDVGSGGSFHVRAADRDWAVDAGPVFARTWRTPQEGRRAPSAQFRVEWPRGNPPVVDLFDGAERQGPRWVDVIAPTRTEVGGLVRVRLGLNNGKPKPTRFEVTFAGDASTRALRRLGFGWLVEEADRLLADWAVGQALGPAWRREIRRPGRAGRPDLHYALWAHRYAQALAAEERSPVQRIIREEQAAGRHVTKGQVAGAMNRARARGLFTGAPPGKAGGKLTAKAKSLLAGTGMEV